ncbi:MAG: peroxide stress protein YaaA [Proteobacteria bacterium]|nr:peroxide stress protein YaaA [Pseudomonadota bacterium]
MLAILSPAKTLDYQTPLTTDKSSAAEFNGESKELIATLRKFAPADIASLMKISDKLAELNHRRYAEWQPKPSDDNARPAVFAFKGDVYQGLDAGSMSARDINFAQKHLRVLSGLYGLLRPLDLMQPYRLEMGTRLATRRGSNLYEFWGNKVTDHINKALAEQSSKVLVNLASNEYYNVVQPERIDGRILNINFKELRDGKYRFVSFSAKKARGLMARYMVDQRITRVSKLRQFNVDNYAFNDALSDDDNWIFTR